MDAGVERPWEGRTYHIPDLRAWVRERRGDLIWAALTIARAWFVAGCRKGERALGMFEQWSHVIGGMLKVAGVEGFLTNTDDFYNASDVESDVIGWFVAKWAREHRGEHVRVNDLAAWALDPASPVLQMFDVKGGDRSVRTAFSLWVRRLNGRVIALDGARVRIAIVRSVKRAADTKWHLDAVEGQPWEPRQASLSSM